MSSKRIGIEDVPGFTISATQANIKASGALDMGLIIAEAPAAAAGVFTTNRVVAAPVRWSQRILPRGRGQARAILVNAGNANACTGDQGRDDAEESARAVAAGIGCAPHEVLLCSTGVIGHPLPMEKMQAGIASMIQKPGGRKGRFPKAIMTTDLTPKAAGVAMPELGGAVLAGVAKGSGMIAPNMATMLGFLLTDAHLAPAALAGALREVVEDTFNRVTVDGDTSTNDTVLALASGVGGGARIQRPVGPAFRAFQTHLHAVCLSLAEAIAADGEGATKLVRVRVTGAASDEDAHRAARTIAESPLVKTALFGNDPNWGRILAAAGRSGCALEEAKTVVRLCGECIFAHGAPRVIEGAALAKKMKAKAIELEVDLGLGTGACRMLTCDFSYDYVKINAEYHT